MNYSRLLDFLWRAGHLTGREFTSVAGEKVEIVSEGQYDHETGVWYGAELVVDGERRRGTTVIGEKSLIPAGTVLRVVDRFTPQVLGVDDRLVPQIEYPIEPHIRECYDSLREGAADRRCAGLITAMSSLHRTSLFTGLMIERLQRKYGDVMRVFAETDSDWNQTFYTMLLRVMGGDRNRETYMALAAKVSAAMLSREKNSLLKLEALLLGGGGFLFAPSEMRDAYTLRLEEEFRHLAAKYSIVPLKPAEWDTAGLHISNYPALRLVELAALFSKKDFMLDGMLACRTAGDVERMFAAQASEYWDTHYKPGAEYGYSPKRIGRTKTALIGINLAAPLMFAYGRETGCEELCERALDLLADIPAEQNRRLAGWYERGCGAENAFESQALLQLGNEYCASGRCAECVVGKAQINLALR
jgi:hypothetical protein